jgi:hypothetical protein
MICSGLVTDKETRYQWPRTLPLLLQNHRVPSICWFYSITLGIKNYFAQRFGSPDQAPLADRRFEDRSEMNIESHGTGAGLLVRPEDKHGVCGATASHDLLPLCLIREGKLTPTLMEAAHTAHNSQWWLASDHGTRRSHERDRC